MTGRIMLNFSNNTFNDTREIHGFTKGEITEIKKMVAKLKTEDTDGKKLNNYLKSKLHLSTEIFNQYASYLKKIKLDEDNN